MTTTDYKKPFYILKSKIKKFEINTKTFFTDYYILEKKLINRREI